MHHIAVTCGALWVHFEKRSRRSFLRTRPHRSSGRKQTSQDIHESAPPQHFVASVNPRPGRASRVWPTQPLPLFTSPLKTRSCRPMPMVVFLPGNIYLDLTGFCVHVIYFHIATELDPSTNLVQAIRCSYIVRQWS
jgi:hypothetical protein